MRRLSTLLLLACLSLTAPTAAPAFELSAEPAAPQAGAGHAELACFAPCTITATAAPGERPYDTSGPLHWFAGPPTTHASQCWDDCYHGTVHEQEGDTMSFVVPEAVVEQVDGRPR